MCLSAPADAPVVDPFRPPACPWCPGNRGLEFGTRPGDGIRAMAPGRVIFAGAVAEVLYVTLRHEAGLLSTYGRLGQSLVRVGQIVAAGDLVGRAGGPTIVTLRVDPRDGPGRPDTPEGPVYLDPAPLIGRPSWRPRLVPLDGTPARAPRAGGPVCGAGPGVGDDEGIG